MISFKTDILPMFRPVDIEHMKVHGVHLDAYEYMSDPNGGFANAHAVQKTLMGPKPSMPPGGPYWAQQQLDVLQQWIDGECAP